VKLQVEVLPQASVAVDVTVVVPIGKAVPLAGELTTLTTPQLSVAVTVKLTTAVHDPMGVVAVLFAGQVKTGPV
jgi:hypothetical protein